jgi:hypothetical protein
MHSIAVILLCTDALIRFKYLNIKISLKIKQANQNLM